MKKHTKSKKKEMNKSQDSNETKKVKKVMSIEEALAYNNISEQTLSSILKLFSYRRPSSSHNTSQCYKEFLEKYIEPYFGKPDAHGNYIRIINDAKGDHPRISYMAHHDTVHNKPGMQTDNLKLEVDNSYDIYLKLSNPLVKKITKSYTIATGVNKGEVKSYLIDDVNDENYKHKSSCLGADCTIGIWLILEMIDCGCPGVYVIHNDEEVGCRGSSALVSDYELLTGEERENHWISKVDIAISFDRFGETSIITNQLGCRTASDDFANELSNILGPVFDRYYFDRLQCDSKGAFTDSNEYIKHISECTNLSVGYYSQHTENESQNIVYAVMLRDALIEYSYDLNDPNILKSYRDPSEVSNFYGYEYGYRSNSYNYASDYSYYEDEDGYNTGYHLRGNVWFGIDTAYFDEGASLTRSELSQIEQSWNDSIGFRLYDNIHSDNYTEDEKIEMLASWLIDYPYLSATLMVRNKVNKDNFIMRLKDEAFRASKIIKYENVFKKSNEDSDIPF